MTPPQFLRLIRFPNIFIVALTQLLLQYAILLPALKICETPARLPVFHYILLVFTTCLIAASGYVVNDIEDVAIDRINKPEHKRIVERMISIKTAWLIYGFMVALGLVISIYLAVYIQDIVQLAIYPIAVFLLWAYAKWFKKMPLIGNIVVAGFCAFVAWVVYYAQSLYGFYSDVVTDIMLFDHCRKEVDYMQITFIGYAVFAFISTLFREIIKDIEDVNGDLSEGCKTLPVVVGIFKSKIIAAVCALLLLTSVVFFTFQLRGGLLIKIFLNIIISIPTLYALFLLVKANKKEDYARLSFIAKLIMLSGVVFILIMVF